jgi:hypothetical protein
VNLREMIENASKKAGEQKTLAGLLGVTPTNLSDCKAGKRGIPDEACAKLAALLNMPYGQVQAARNEWLAKTDEEKRFWHPFVMGRAAMILASTALVGATALPSESHAAQGSMTPATETIGIM